MDGWAAVALVAIVVGTSYSYLKRLNFSLVVCGICGVVFGIQVVNGGSWSIMASDTSMALAFMPEDLVEPARTYTVITSMFAHADFGHILLNMLGLAFIGMPFEERVGTRPFIVLYFLSGLAGTLVFAVARWDDPYVAVVGASGAISGVLGAYARTFPNERMSMILMFIPLPPMRIWVIVGLFVLIQMVLAFGSTNIAWEAHLGGLAAGILFAPVVAKMPLHRRMKRMVSLSTLRRLATTPELKAMLRMIESEEIPDVRSAWIEDYLRKARCPSCGASLKVRKDSVTCERGHML
ncbi:MAG: rhomboid family intramembrane serine protease [Thermoplasmata archaeon]|jgi:membrane associated rhomboid family serine protease|nr:rhomboid family intramembrane serine protease [Thermoplasmata archaeon]